MYFNNYNCLLSYRVIPCLSQEFVNPSMVPFVLPNVLKIAEWSTNEEFVDHVLPYLRDVMKLREPVQVSINKNLNFSIFRFRN